MLKVIKQCLSSAHVSSIHETCCQLLLYNPNCLSKDPHHNMLQSLISMQQHESKALCALLIWIRYLCMCLNAFVG